MTSPNLAGLIEALCAQAEHVALGYAVKTDVTAAMTELMSRVADARAALRTVSDEPGAGWRSMESAPKDATEVILRVPQKGWPDHYQKIGHWAQDLSGEEQPPFRGWFYNTGYGFAGITPEPTGWRALAAPDPAIPADTQSREGEKP